MKKATALLMLFLWVPSFGLFSYNSGYGYDALEILVPSQAMADGHAFYSFVSAKPPALYFTVTAVVNLGIPINHLSMTLLIVAIGTLCPCVVFLFCSRIQQGWLPHASATLVGFASLFMELNFLIAEGFVVTLGYLALVFYLNYEIKREIKYLFLAACCLGVGFLFKQSAAFISIGIVCHMMIQKVAIINRLLGVALFFAGHLVVIAIVAIAFSLSHRGGDFLYWTFIYPLIGFPSSYEFLNRIYTKLLWFLILLLATLIVAFLRWNRVSKILARTEMRLLLLCSLFSLYPLLKSQAPHYYFPFAVLMTPVIVAIWFGFLRDLGTKTGSWRFAMLLGGLLVLGLAGSVAIYQPNSVKRLLSIKAFDSEFEDVLPIQSLVPAESPVLYMTEDCMRLYLMTRRYPNNPITNFDVQCEYLLRTSPRLFEDSLRDPRLKVVIFDPSQPPEFRIDSVDPAERKQFWVEFSKTLTELFVRRDDLVTNRVLWIKKE